MIAAPLKDGRFGEARVSLTCASFSTLSFHLGAFQQDRAPQESDIVKLAEEREPEAAENRTDPLPDRSPRFSTRAATPLPAILE
jgi:hypothetical protein